MLECRRCGAKFSSLGTFDQHRVGRLTDAGPDYGRRCISQDEWTALGNRIIGDRWKGPAWDASLVFARDAGEPNGDVLL